MLIKANYCGIIKISQKYILYTHVLFTLNIKNIVHKTQSSNLNPKTVMML